MKLSTRFFILSFIQAVVGSVFVHSYIWLDNDKFGHSAFAFYCSAVVCLLTAVIIKEEYEKEK